MEKLENFKFDTHKWKDGKVEHSVQYIGNNPKIDGAKCVYSEKFATYHYIEALKAKIRDLEEK